MDSLSRHTDYGGRSFLEGDVASDPIAQFSTWLEDAERAGIYEPNAMVVSTVDPDGVPSSRTVLLKGVGADGFDFATNYGSRKGLALAGTASVSLLFPWYQVQRQVIVTGRASFAPASVSDEYFEARPRDSRIASAASDQSRPIGSRDELDEKVRALAARYPDPDTPARPDDWGAYRVVPSRIEFWQGRTSRLHDRLVFTLGSTGWTLGRLQP